MLDEQITKSEYYKDMTRGEAETRLNTNKVALILRPSSMEGYVVVSYKDYNEEIHHDLISESSKDNRFGVYGENDHGTPALDHTDSLENIIKEALSQTHIIRANPAYLSLISDDQLIKILVRDSSFGLKHVFCLRDDLPNKKFEQEKKFGQVPRDITSYLYTYTLNDGYQDIKIYLRNNKLYTNLEHAKKDKDGKSDELGFSTVDDLTNFICREVENKSLFSLEALNKFNHLTFESSGKPQIEQYRQEVGKELESSSSLSPAFHIFSKAKVLLDSKPWPQKEKVEESPKYTLEFKESQKDEEKKPPRYTGF